MKLKRIIAEIAVIATAVTLTSCGTDSKNIEDKIIGEWTLSSESTVNTDAKYLTFFEGGSAANSGESGTWSISGNTLSVMGTYGGQFFSHDNLVGKVKISGDTMTITDPCVDGDNHNGKLVYERED